MLNTLDAIVQRVVDGYDPERVILFGSHATGRARPDSDLDLLIVKQDDRRPIDRRLAVERLLADRRVPIDLVVYTPREMWQLFLAGSPFLDEILESGRVLYMRNAMLAVVGLVLARRPALREGPLAAAGLFAALVLAYPLAAHEPFDAVAGIALAVEGVGLAASLALLRPRRAVVEPGVVPIFLLCLALGLMLGGGHAHG